MQCCSISRFGFRLAVRSLGVVWGSTAYPLNHFHSFHASRGFRLVRCFPLIIRTDSHRVASRLNSETHRNTANIVVQDFVVQNSLYFAFCVTFSFFPNVYTPFTKHSVHILFKRI